MKHQPAVRALGTGQHGAHHRRLHIEDGIRIQFVTCDAGTPPWNACPDEVDPLVRWAEKLMTPPKVPLPEPEPLPDRTCPRCQESWQRIVKNGRETWFPYCRSCNAERRRPAAA
jgi:hypothetical protein